MRVGEIAERVGGSVEGDANREIHAAAPIELAGPDELAFAATPKALAAARSSDAGCLIVGEQASLPGRTLIRVPNPRAAFARVLAALYPSAEPAAGVHPTAIVDAAATIHPSAYVGPGCVIEADVIIGRESRLHSRVTVYRGVTIGQRVLIHAGVVIGADGFGFEFADGRYHKFPQVGRVEIGDDVEIGANSTIDRAALGVTRIGEGTKLDNLVHVGHNVTIGKHVVIAAQTGISGGAVVEDYVVCGGQVGIADKVRIESKAVLGAQCGVPSNKIIRGGETVWGTPARPIQQYLKSLAELNALTRKRRP
jgi:UDP-3-O-[3-hydroxymyristoyl] glucosamine N-acyltransferase